MSIQLYNTLSRKKEKLIPLEPGRIKMYVCGPTVYSYIHIGNARPVIFFDVVRRYLKYRGYDVTYIQNFTDIDDKLIKASEEMGEPAPVIAEKFIKAYESDAKALGITPADVHPRVTEHMDEIIQFILKLIEKGVAYMADGDVYFDTTKFSEYGKLSHQNVEELQAGSRIEVNESKRSPLDFALWKKAKPGEICWESPWGKGRPGWHIECSAMSMKYLGETFDIHAGGYDLTFPHHENEIAQTESLTGKMMAKYWLHNGYININNEKMSKSLGNVIRVVDLLKQFEGEVIRFFMLSTHYRNPIQFSYDSLQQAKNGLERIKTGVSNLKHRIATAVNDPLENEMKEKIDEFRTRFIERMDDDFNTSDAIAILFDMVKESNIYLRQEQVHKETIQSYLHLFDELGEVLGFQWMKEESLLDRDIEKWIQERNEARKEKDYARADEIRDMLLAKGIVLEDTPHGVRWKRK
ncbi:cysteine--tRNA ligase [Microaerobacter geothermalis]|uniref:cysteine--tRNA ligase n=1 Tax=Microaerobacter geothermalis TaxID=674972 RepID=UPI001F02E686|nr:cysteine--tRNA ligase [Microaerobacter geothermalis]MCF6095180.1 cysteine--tRNA ligase [Microaerobacter geothermalis]